MKIYNYHNQTGVFTGASDARESPLEPGEFLVPGFATKIKPPVAPTGQYAVFKNNKWSIEDIQVTEEEKLQTVINIRNNIQTMLDNQAKSLDFESILEAMTYAEESSVPKFQEQAKQLRAWRSLVWAKYDELIQEYKDKGILEPVSKEVLDKLPKFKDTVQAQQEQ